MYHCVVVVVVSSSSLSCGTKHSRCLCRSISLPEKLEYIANKYAEHSHDKWSSEKVGVTYPACTSLTGANTHRVDLCYRCVTYFLLQVSAGWKHGDSLDEQARTHPLLRPYKALSEKVLDHTGTLGTTTNTTNDRTCVLIHNYTYIYIYILKMSLLPGERNLPLASEGVVEEHVGHGLEHREDQGRRSHVPTAGEREATQTLRVSGKKNVVTAVCWLVFGFSSGLLHKF